MKCTQQRWVVSLVVLVSACSIDDDVAPSQANPLEQASGRPTNEGIDFEQATREMAPLTLGDEASAHRASIDAAIEKRRVFHDGVPVLGMRVRVRRLPDGRRVVLDRVRAPTRIGMARLREPDAMQIAHARYPDLEPGRVSAAYIAERDASLTYAWQVELRRTLTDTRHRLERIVTIDAESGQLLRDDMAYAQAAASIEGHGFYFPDLKIEGSADDVDPAKTCLRDPNISSGAWGACGDVGITDPLSTLGVATAFPTKGGFAPVSTLTGRLGNAKCPGDAQDSEGLQTQAFDAHVGATRAIRFFREAFGRTFIGSKLGDSLLVVVDPTLIDTSRAEWPFSMITVGLRSNPNAACKAHPDILMHEYAHLVLYAEGIEFGVESKALHEGIADIFGILMEPTLDHGGGSIIAPPEPWLFPSDATAMAGPQRKFARPSDDGHSPDAVGDPDPTGVPWDKVLERVTGAHDGGGPMRRWFYFLAKGASPGMSPYLPHGMHGIGTDAAARLLYRAIADAAFPTAYPTYAEFREGMLTDIGVREQCSTAYKAARDAWAAVKVGAPVDRVAPSVTGTVQQLDNMYVRVTARSTDQGDGLGAGATVQVLVNNVQLGLVPLMPVPLASDLHGYTGSVDLPLGLFLSFGFGPFDVSLRVRDWCGNTTTGSAGTLSVDLTAPTISELRDLTSTHAWTTNADGTLRVQPFDLSSPRRTLRAIANDPSGLAQMSLATPQQQSAWSFSDAVIAANLPIDLSVSEPGASVTLTVTDRFDNASYRIVSPFVDAARPAHCGVQCSQMPNSERISCYLSARDEESGVFAVRTRTVAPSPQIITLLGPPVLRQEGPVSLVFDDWHWYFADRVHTDGQRTYRHGPGETFVAELSTTSAVALPFGDYRVQLECRDFWGNVAEAHDDLKISQRPTLALEVVSTDNQGNYSYSMRATDADGVWKFEVQNITANFQFTSGCGTPGNRPTTCTQTFQGTGTPGQTVRLWIVAKDIHGASTGQHLEVVLPQPPPPPPPSGIWITETETAWPGQLLAANVIGVNGKLRYIADASLADFYDFYRVSLPAGGHFDMRMTGPVCIHERVVDEQENEISFTSVDAPDDWPVSSAFRYTNTTSSTKTFIVVTNITSSPYCDSSAKLYKLYIDR